MPAASIFVEGGNGQTTRRGTPFPSRVTVRVFDEMGAWMAGEDVKFSLPASLLVPSGRFPGGVFDFTAATDAAGRASSEFIEADDLLGAWFGTVEVVSAPTVRTDFYLSNVTPFGVPTQIVITDGGTQSAAQYTAYTPVEVWLGDAFGVGVGPATVTMTCPADRGTFPGGSFVASAITGSDGYATFPPFTASGVLGIFEPAVAYPGVTHADAFFTTIDPAVPVALQVYSGNDQHTPPNFLFIEPLVARVANAINGPVAGIAVTFDAPDSGASLVWALPFTDPVTRITDAGGLATSPSMTANATAGTYNVVASATLSFGVTEAFFQLTNGGASPVPDAFPLLSSEA